MSLSDKAIKLRDKAEKESEKVLMAEFEEYDAGRNTRRERRQLLRMAHYYHLLQNMGIDDSGYRMEKYWELANKKIQQAREYDGKTREIAESRLIDEHIRAWNMAEYYYERGTKHLWTISYRKKQVPVFYIRVRISRVILTYWTK